MIELKKLDFNATNLNLADIYRAIQAVQPTPEDILIEKIKEGEDLTAEWKSVSKRTYLVPTFQLIRILKTVQSRLGTEIIKFRY